IGHDRELVPSLDVCARGVTTGEYEPVLDDNGFGLDLVLVHHGIFRVASVHNKAGGKSVNVRRGYAPSPPAFEERPAGDVAVVNCGPIDRASIVSIIGA